MIPFFYEFLGCYKVGINIFGQSFNLRVEAGRLAGGDNCFSAVSFPVTSIKSVEGGLGRVHTRRQERTRRARVLVEGGTVEKEHSEKEGINP